MTLGGTVRNTNGRCIAVCLGEHFFGHINAKDLSRWAHPTCSRDAVQSGTASEVQRPALTQGGKAGNTCFVGLDSPRRLAIISMFLQLTITH